MSNEDVLRLPYSLNEASNEDSHLGDSSSKLGPKLLFTADSPVFIHGI